MRNRRYGRFSLGGLLLILIGLAWLLDETGYLQINWKYAWPVVFIVLGVLLVVRRLWCGYCCYGYASKSWTNTSGPNPPSQ